jgi:hypothetical protein
MATAGPDPNSDTPVDPETRRNTVAESGVSRMGMPSMLTGLLVVGLAILFVVWVLS